MAVEVPRALNTSRLGALLRSQTAIVTLVFAAIVAFFAFVWKVPTSILLLGALFGAISSLLALGIALVWRANRIINFAAGDLGAAPVAFACALMLGSFGLNWWVAGAVGVAAAVALGFLVEVLIVRRFFKSPRLILTVATIGIAQVLTGLSLFIPRWFDLSSGTVSTLPAPFQATITISSYNFRGPHILAALAVPVAFVALTALLRFTRVGIAIRASAQRADRAASLGVPVQHINTIVWVLATLLSFLALYLHAGITGPRIGSALGSTVLLRALAAAVIGRMEHMPTIAIAAIGIGVIEQAVIQHWGREAYINPVLFVVIMIALFLVPTSSGRRVDDDSVSTWRATREVRPVPRELRGVPEVRWGRWVLAGGIVAFVLTLPLWLGARDLNLATLTLIFAIIAISLVVLTGWAGQVSLGQMGFVGIGAAVGGAVTDRLGFDLAVAMIIAGFAGAVAAVIVGLPALRRRGLTLAVMTLAFGMVVSTYLLNRTFFGQGSDRDWLPGRRVERASFFGIDVSSERAFFFLCAAALVVTIALVYGLRHSRTGRALVAIRENERAAQSYGIHARRTTLVAFAFSGFLAAFAGALYVHHQTTLMAEAYSPERSLQVFSMVVIGGLGSVPGAILGAVYVRVAQGYFPFEWQFLATGGGLLLVLMLLPGGLGGALADARDSMLRWIAKRRGIVVPSLLADVRVEDASIPEAEAAKIVEAAEEAVDSIPEHTP